jgi:4-hydroxy-3-polyprenylbenzoate decarboxylase
MPGVVAIQTNRFISYDETQQEIERLNAQLLSSVSALQSTPFIILCDDAAFTSATLGNYVWVTYTRSNPAYDIYGIDAFTSHKHWGCRGSLIIDARIKPHHAPPLELDPTTEKKVDRFFAKGGELAQWG